VVKWESKRGDGILVGAAEEDLERGEVFFESCRNGGEDGAFGGGVA